MKMKKQKKIPIPVISGTVLGVKVYRGYAPLSVLSQMSQADIYDQVNNPTGTQRDLSPKHAKDAYEYVRDQVLGYWPEVFLCARKMSVIKFTPDSDNSNCGILSVDLAGIEKNKNHISISRIDGNHRLHYADGHEPGMPQIKKEVSFCLAVNLTLDNEISLFRDINNNQKRMNTSHLDNIETRLTGEQKLMQNEPDLYIAQRLGRSTDSPFYGMVYEGGVKESKNIIPLRALKSGINRMLSQQTKLKALKDAEAQYKVIRNYFDAVKLWIPNAWKSPKDYLALRGSGLWGLCALGANVIDRALGKGAFEPQEMLQILSSGKKWDWTNKGSFQGFGGWSGAIKIGEMISDDFSDESGISVKELYKKIMG
jgi:DGQHR domain-containing protein